jgi:hypothetical protein
MELSTLHFLPKFPNVHRLEFKQLLYNFTFENIEKFRIIKFIAKFAKKCSCLNRQLAVSLRFFVVEEFVFPTTPKPFGFYK